MEGHTKIPTTAEDADIVDLKQEGPALLIDQLVLHYADATEGEFLGLTV